MTALNYKPPAEWGMDLLLKNDFVPVADVGEVKNTAAAGAGFPSRGHTYFAVTKCVIGFREASRLVKIAEENACVIKLVAGNAIGTTNSILSIIKMGIKADTSLGLGIVALDGGNATNAFAECHKVLSGY